ncbi:glycosidase [Catenuloplanes nepalensis]|uniref:Glycosidase n=1 Tax=Catenuloplanes nepalensis TaxID=587533 RepID=A0ABT9MS85_9ACTN|nr:alpha-amylase family glycosyl hydrolase [Catenuloplanes nepalensis]MDP9794302.1 glycosidase [Catenuloplanes nepalensis]
MYQNLGASAEGDTVTFRVFIPDAGRDPSQYDGDAFSFIRDIRVVGSFQRAGGGWAWDAASAPRLERTDHPSGHLYVLAISGLPEGWYEYKYLVTFEGGAQRWVTDPCTKYVGRNDENSGFVIGGPPLRVRDLRTRLPLSDIVMYEINPLDATSSYRGDRSPADALRDKLDHIADLGANAIQFMPWTGRPGGSAFGWGYDTRHFFAVDEQLVADPRQPANRLHQLGALIDAAHERDIAVYLDAVVNHVSAGGDPGSGFGYRWLYRDPGDSPYLGPYQGGLFFDDLQYRNGCTQKFAADVCRYWLDRFRFDGVRLDYTRGFMRAGDVTTGAGRLVRDLRDELDASGRERVPVFLEHLTDDRYAAIDDVNRVGADGMWLDQKMYQLQDAVRDERPPTRLVRALDSDRGFAGGACAITFLSTHDESTILAGGGERAQWWRMQPALVALFTTAGAVLIRNGEEFGQQFHLPRTGDGRVVPRPLDWSLADDAIGRSLRALHRRLADLRAAHPALRRGAFRPFPYDLRADAFDENGQGVHTARGLVVFARTGARPPGSPLAGDEHVVVALNFSGSAQRLTLRFPHDGSWEELLDDADVKVTDFRAGVTVPSHWARVFVCAD